VKAYLSRPFESAVKGYWDALACATNWPASQPDLLHSQLLAASAWGIYKFESWPISIYSPPCYLSGDARWSNDRAQPDALAGAMDDEESCGRLPRDRGPPMGRL
jgi:hypothetical protein